MLKRFIILDSLFYLWIKITLYYLIKILKFILILQVQITQDIIIEN